MANYLTETRIDEIMTVVEDLIAEHGYEGVRVDQIAKAARTSTATIYRNWGSKSGLAVGLLAEGAVARSRQTPDTGSLISDLHALIDTGSDVRVRGIRILISIALAMRDDEDLARAYREKGLPALVGVVDAVVQRAVVRGEIDRDVPVLGLLTTLILSPLVVSGFLLDGDVGAAEGHEFIDLVIAPLLRPHLTRRAG